MPDNELETKIHKLEAAIAKENELTARAEAVARGKQPTDSRFFTTDEAAKELLNAATRKDHLQKQLDAQLKQAPPNPTDSRFEWWKALEQRNTKRVEDSHRVQKSYKVAEMALCHE